MYLPKHFEETDLAELHNLIERHSFGLLISPCGDETQASHLPLLLDRTAGPSGTLIGHMARANPQWQQAEATTVLAVFSGPHAYISPSWYEAENVVPTWNYTAVHVYGRFQAIHDSAELTNIVQAYVDKYERSRPAPWQFDRESTFIDRLVQQIVGFRIPIERLEGKWKLNQNHPRERREKVIDALNARGNENSRDIARLMAGMLND